ncbi:MAG: hypothetical protein HQK96_13520 [Nitrospirae bacterium]|nr:hypothetical protein [Nitrospirota bacterium]
MEICRVCNGKGTVKKTQTGIRPFGEIVPAWGDESCPVCHGKGQTGDVKPSVKYETCLNCGGSGTIFGTAMGMGASGMVPSFAKITCTSCGGRGRFEVKS